MTDILARLAALTARDENGALPCSHCSVSRCSAYKSDYGGWMVGCGSCGSHTGVCKTKEAAILLHNTRPREAALTALVREAVGEIDRLKKWRELALASGEREEERLAEQPLSPSIA